MKKNIEYQRGEMSFNGKVHYHIERKVNGGKWKIVLEALTLEEANDYLINPTLIELEVKKIKNLGIFLVTLVVAIIILILVL